MLKSFHQLNCKIYRSLYLFQCQVCHHQYVDNSENAFNSHLKNHRKSSKAKKKEILACKSFQTSNHNFRRDAKFTPIEKTMKPSTIEQLQLILKKRKSSSILKLKTLHQDGLKQELNEIQEVNF